MPRGIKKNAEIDQMEIEPVKSNAEPVASNAEPVEVIGDMKAAPAKPDPMAEGAFKRVKAPRKGWVKMTVKEMLEFQEQGILVGYDAAEGVGLLAKEE